MSEADDIEELTIRLGGVTISIRGALSGAGARGLASGDSAQGESASATHSLAGAHRRASEGEILAATSAQDLAALHLPELVPLARQLRGTDATWTPFARLGRAYRAGVSAATILRGDQGLAVRAPPIPHRNVYYVILRCAVYEDGLWTTSYATFRRFSESASGEFNRDSVCHAFPSRAEVDAYLLGAGREWPRHL